MSAVKVKVHIMAEHPNCGKKVKQPTFTTEYSVTDITPKFTVYRATELFNQTYDR